MSTSEAKKTWMRENTKVVTVRFTRNTEQKYLDFLEDKPIATTIKRGLDLLMSQEAPTEPEEKTHDGILLKGVSMPDRRGFVDARIYGDGSVLLPCGNQLVESSAEAVKY